MSRVRVLPQRRERAPFDAIVWTASDAELATHEREKVTVSSVNLYDFNLFFFSLGFSLSYTIFL